LAFRDMYQIGPPFARAVWLSGALVGPPWSKRENGFMLSETQPDGIKLYYEPHCDYDEAAVAKIGKVDAVVTPANSQVLINFPLVRFWRSCSARTLRMQPFFARAISYSRVES